MLSLFVWRCEKGFEKTEGQRRLDLLLWGLVEGFSWNGGLIWEEVEMAV